MVEIEAFKQKQQEVSNSTKPRNVELRFEASSEESRHDQASGVNEIDMKLVDEVRSLLRDEYKKNSDKFSPVHYEQIMDDRSSFVCWRYLKHCDHKPNDAFDLMKWTLAWRKENSFDDIRNEQSPKEFWHWAPFIYTGVSKDGKDVLYITGKNYRKSSALFWPKIKHFCLTVLANWERQHLHDLKDFIMVFDVSDTGFRNIDMEFASWIISVKDCLPARINVVYVTGIPFIVRPLIRLIISWLPEKFSKIVHCGTYEQLIAPNIDKDNLPAEAGGELDDIKYRLAPIEAPWKEDMPEYDDKTMNKALEESIGFCVDKERRAKLHTMQKEYENKALKN